MSGKILTLQMIYKEGAEILEHAGISDAKLDAWYLLEYVTGISRLLILVIRKEKCRRNRQKVTGKSFSGVPGIFRCSILPGNRSLWDILSW